MKTHILFQDKRWKKVPLKKICNQALRLAVSCTQENSDNCAVALLACDNAEMSRLNFQFRQKARPTNVLAWPEHNLQSLNRGRGPKKLIEIKGAGGKEIFIGNLALSYDSCFLEAKHAEKHFENHCQHLLIHGCLHLLGFSHYYNEDAVLMERIERKILSQVGINNSSKAG